MTPLERVETLYRELVLHYHEAEDAELRAAAKLLLVAIAEIRRHGGSDWQGLLNEYVQIASQEPERFERLLRASRTASSDPTESGELLC